MKRVMATLITILMIALNCLQPVVYASEAESGVTENNTTESDTDVAVKSPDEIPENQAALNISAPSAILMEASTGTIIFEKNSGEVLRPASITKIMTLILIFDALKEGKIKLEDKVTVSEYAASMGGSQVFLEPGETQTVDTMIKCISVASANDACVSYRKRKLIKAVTI